MGALTIQLTNSGENLHDGSIVANASYLFAGDGFFETMLWSNQTLVDLDLHLQRMESSLETFYKTEIPELDIQDSVEKCINEMSLHGEARVRLTAMYIRSQVEIYLTVSEYQRSFDPATVEVSSYRPSKYRPTAGHKSVSYADYAWALKDAKKNGVDEAVLLNSDNLLCECSTSNLFYYHDKVLYTPSLETGCLPGVMRALVLQKAENVGIQVQEGEYSLSDLLKADGMFVTSSLRRIQTVSRCGTYVFPSNDSEIIKLLMN